MIRLVIGDKKKIMLSTIVLMVILFFIILNIGALTNRVEGYEEPQYIEIVVQSGDTIWSLVREYASKDKDIRESIYEIGVINNLSSYDIFPGQVIKVPKE